MKFPHYTQLDRMDCGPTCLRMIAKHYGKHFSAQSMREKAQISRIGVSLLGIAEAAESIGFRTIGIQIPIVQLVQEVPLPCILHWGQKHFVVLYEVSQRFDIISKLKLKRIIGGRRPNRTIGQYLSDSPDHESDVILEKVNTTVFHIADPATGLQHYTIEEFNKHWLSTANNGIPEGIALLLHPTTQFYEQTEESNKGLSIANLSIYVTRYKSLILQLVISVIAGSGLNLLFPILTQSVVDVGIGTQNLSFIYLVLIAQLVLLLSTSMVDFLRSWILLHISTRLNLTILSEFLSKLLRLPVSFFESKQFGDIIQRIGDHNRIESFLTGQTINLIFSLFNLLVFGALLAYYQLSIFFIAFIASFLYTIWVVFFLKKRRKLDSRRFEISSRSQSQVIQLIQGIQDIKLAGAEMLKRWEWERTQALLFKWNIKNLSVSQFQQAGGLLINQSKNVLITFLSAKAVLDGVITLGEMMSIQYILGQFNAPVEQMIGFLQSWQDAQTSLERLNEISQLNDEEPINQNVRHEWNSSQDIKISNLNFAYPGAGNANVLTNINVIIPHGKTTAIVGTSGSGKTTLLKLLLRFYELKIGDISLTAPSITTKEFSNSNERELSLKYISYRAWRQRCGVVMQEGFIFSDTIARNICIFEEVIDQERLFKAAKTANIDSFIESLPLGFHTKIGAEGNGISQGQKQRILIARAVYTNPQLLLFDEATNALDASNEATIIKNLEDFFKGRTVIVVAHRLSTVRHADQILVMQKGEIVEKGTHDELVKMRGAYYELVSNQLELAS